MACVDLRTVGVKLIITAQQIGAKPLKNRGHLHEPFSVFQSIFKCQVMFHLQFFLTYELHRWLCVHISSQHLRPEELLTQFFSRAMSKCFIRVTEIESNQKCLHRKYHLPRSSDSYNYKMLALILNLYISQWVTGTGNIWNTVPTPRSIYLGRFQSEIHTLLDTGEE